MSALTSISENASRLSMRIQEQFSEHTRDLPFARSSASAYLDPSEDSLRLIRKQLDSSSDREKLEAMKRLVAVPTQLIQYHTNLNSSSHSLSQKGATFLSILHRLSRMSRPITSKSGNSYIYFSCDMPSKNPISLSSLSILSREI
jgi:AP-3 complex subunit beta